MDVNDMLRKHSFRIALQPYVTWACLIIITILTLTNGYAVFIPSQWNVSDLLVAYMKIPISLGLYLGHKMWTSTHYVMKECSWNGSLHLAEMTRKWRRHWCFARRAKNVDVVTVKQEMDELEYRCAASATQLIGEDLVLV